MKKSDLKTGMIVITEDNECRIVLGNTLISYSSGGYNLNWFNDNLIENKTTKFNGREVLKIYSEPKKNSGLCAGLDFWLDEKEILKYCKLLWERKPEKTFELDGVEYSESTLRSLIKKANE